MAEPDVPGGEMVPRRRSPDPLADLLSGSAGDASDGLGRVAEDLWSAFVPDVLERSAELAALTDRTRPPAPPVLAPRGRGVKVVVGTFLATLGGKIVLGGAVAAAAVGGLHAAEVVDVPLLPDVGTHEGDEPTTPDPDSDLPPVPQPGLDDDPTDGGTNPPTGGDPAGNDPTDGGSNPPTGGDPAGNDPTDGGTNPPTGGDPAGNDPTDGGTEAPGPAGSGGQPPSPTSTPTGTRAATEGPSPVEDGSGPVDAQDPVSVDGATGAEEKFSPAP